MPLRRKLASTEAIDVAEKLGSSCCTVLGKSYRLDLGLCEDLAFACFDLLLFRLSRCVLSFDEPLPSHAPAFFSIRLSGWVLGDVASEDLKFGISFELL